MKNLILLYLSLATFFAVAQVNKVARMEPILTNGYYVTLRGDTIQGKIQVNPPSTEDFYKQFYFQAPRSKKTKLFTVQRAKAYGYDDKNFVTADLNGKKLFIERLVTGRLRFYEFKYSEKADLNSNLESVYFIKDTEAEDASLKKLKKITPKFYKKTLKPFMQDQPAVWSELDKYNFSEQNIISAVNQFNMYYEGK